MVSSAHSSDVPAAARTLELLRLLASRGPSTASSLASQSGMPRSTAYHLLAVMRDGGFVIHLPAERRWALGPTAFEVGAGYLRHDPLERAARPLLADLADRCQETAHLAVLHGAEVVYLLKEAPRRRPAMPTLVTDIGVRLPATITASGRSLLAALPAAQVRALLPGPRSFVLRTEHGPVSLSALRRVLAAESQRGWASEDGEVVEGYASVACAAVDRAGTPLASVSVTFRREDHHDWSALAAEVVDAARRLSRAMSGR